MAHLHDENYRDEDVNQEDHGREGRRRKFDDVRSFVSQQSN